MNTEKRRTETRRHGDTGAGWAAGLRPAIGVEWSPELTSTSDCGCL